MSVVSQLIGFGLRQVIGDYADNVVQVVGAVEQRFRDHSRTLPKALEQAHQRAWQALGVALAGDGFLDRVKLLFASGDDKGVREQVQLFLKGNAVSFDGTPAAFRQTCLDELKRLRKSGLLSMQPGSPADIARQAAGFARHADPQGLIGEARRAVDGVADALTADYPNLSRLLRAPTPAGPPLLAAAFCYFFRREVETDDELAHGLFFDGLRQLSASQAKAFGEVGKALAALGGHFDALFEQLGRIEAAVEETHAVAVETHGVVLDIQAEQQRSANLHLANAGEIRILREQVQQLLSQVGMTRGEVRPGNSCSIRGEDERRAVKALLARFRRLPAEEQREMPALLNGLGKLQIGAGDFAEARRTFTEVVQVVVGPSDKAEASYNAYRAALEAKDWDAALTAIRQAAVLDSKHFAPFPLHEYEPSRILGSGGFGTAFLCRDLIGQPVVVKALHAVHLETQKDAFLDEARALSKLSKAHESIVTLFRFGYAGSRAKVRPYLVMDYFPGGSLEDFVRHRRTLLLDELIEVARSIAGAMLAAHQRGILHRDLKPANILVLKQGPNWQVRIIDFGLAVRTQAVQANASLPAGERMSYGDSVVGTAKFAPPEQLGELPGVAAGPYSDIYAFGRTCLYALFKETESRGSLWKPREAGKKKLKELLESSIERDYSRRPQSFEPVVKILEGIKRNRHRRAKKSEASEQAAREAEERRLQEEKERLAREEAERERQRAEQASVEAERRRREEAESKRRQEEQACLEAQRRREEEEAKRKQRQEERLRREQEEQQRCQREGEEHLRQLVRAALDRTGGKPTPDDTAQAKDVCRRHKLPGDRAKAVIREAKDLWQREREEQERLRSMIEIAKKAQETARLQQEQEERRRREEAARTEEQRKRRRPEEEQRREDYEHVVLPRVSAARRQQEEEKQRQWAEQARVDAERRQREEPDSKRCQEEKRMKRLAEWLSGCANRTNLEHSLCTPCLDRRTNRVFLDPIIKRGAAVPCSFNKTYYAETDPAECITIALYEGDKYDDPASPENIKLAEIPWVFKPPRRRHEAVLEVTFEYGYQDVLSIQIHDRHTGQKRRFAIQQPEPADGRELKARGVEGQ